MKKKTYIIIGVVVAVIAIAYFVFYKGKSTTTTGPAPLGTKKDGTPYTEADVTRKMGEIKSSPEWYASIQSKAIAENMDLQKALRLNAIYMIESVA